LVSLLTEVTDQFWMVQADTIWKENLFEIIDTDSQEFINAGIIFDSEGSEGLLRYMVGDLKFKIGHLRTPTFENIASWKHRH